MHITRFFLLTILSLLSSVSTVAQEVVVTLTPVQQILPPQVLLYVSDPGKYFNITLTNTSSQQQNVYLAMSLQQVTPSNSVSIIIPSNYPPANPFVIPANGTITLTSMEMKTMFNHIPASQIKTTPGLFDDYSNGSFGLLPEGNYEAQITAYRWTSPKSDPPVVVSNPALGKALFTVCYNAQAPQIISPVKAGSLSGSDNVAELDALTPIFIWTPSLLQCNPVYSQYKYSFKVVEVYKDQNPTEAMEKNPIIYKADNIVVTQCVIPTTVIQSQFYADRTYAAQVTATSTSSNSLNYVMIENEGKSTFHLFKLKTNDDGVGDNDNPHSLPNEEGTGERPDDDNADDGELIIVGDSLSGKISTDSLYTYNFPLIERPQFAASDGARKLFQGQNIKVEWIASTFQGGEGSTEGRPELAYDVEIYSSETKVDLQEILAKEPIYTNRTSELSDSIPWDEIKDKVAIGNYMLLRVNPVVAKGSSVAFMGDSTHIRDFALAELLSRKYFQCSNTINITNTNLTTKKASEFKGKTISIGQYDLTIDKITAGKSGTFSGTGHVLWKPFGYEIGVCVKFSNLKINTDDIVIDGVAQSYSDEEQLSDIQVVDKLFSDWGIDNLISDTNIPYASEISAAGKDKVKDIAKQIDLKKYYEYVKKGSKVYEGLTTGKVENLYMPLCIPKELNGSPVDIQISSMKFAATYATMDIIGEFTLPNTQYTKNDILVLGAPRICISPERFLPESGTLALLSNFTINDPKSTYEMTFNAPENIIEPSDGCFISWHDDKFEMLGIDLDMKIPGLVKDANGTATKEKPVFNVQAQIADWDDWKASINVDPFQVEALPGWTFTASDVWYDHSSYSNPTNMGKFPEGYDKELAGITGIVKDRDGNDFKVSADTDWQGLYIKKVGIKFPKSLEFGTKGDKRLAISGENMFFDQSGATLDLSASDLFSGKTGKAGGWEFSLDKVYVSFIQNNFTKCGFTGKFDVPLLDGEIAYECNIHKMTSNTSNAGQYAYVFKTKQVEGLSLDFFLISGTFNQDQTYFLLESVPTASGTMDTSCELVIGGDVSLGGEKFKRHAHLQ